jgi:cyclopropane-fatty-acyl-phospholipid synthase
MTYSSAIFAEPIAADEPLEEAQARKLRLLLDRLDLKPGQRLLEIGCGWGSLAEIAARDYGVEVTGLTLSEEQKAYAERAHRRRPGRSVSIELTDYRDAGAISTRSPASRWSRRSARIIGHPISRRSPAC